MSFFDSLLGRSVERPAAEQARVDAETSKLALYHFTTCPFCIRTRSAIKRLGLAIEQRDINAEPRYREELRAGGGKTQVPALRIEHDDGRVEWMYESGDINRYLEERFGPA